MKFTIERAELLGALTLASSVAPKRGTIPILGNVLLVTQKKAIAITATDMDRVVTIEAPAVAVGRKGSTTVDAGKLAAFVKATADGSQVEAELVDELRLVLRVGRARVSLPVLPVEDFPTLTPEPSTARLEVAGKALLAALKRVVHAQSNEETRYYLNGVYLHAHGDALRLVATDGHRLALTRLAHEGELPDDLPGIIVPRQAISDLQTLAGETTEPLTFEISPTQLQVWLPGISYSTKLVDGTFPDYERVIPTSNECGFKTDRAGLVGATARCAALIGSGKEKASKALKLLVAEATVNVSMRDPESGEVEDQVDAEMRGATGETGFNSAFMAVALAAFDCASIDMEFTAGGPIMMRDPADPNGHLQLVMAMRV